MFKLGDVQDAESARVCNLAVFEREATSGPERLRVAVPVRGPNPLQVLLPCLTEPFLVLYVLHTPRGGGKAGRYQSPLLQRDQLTSFLANYAAFLATDGRHDLWVHTAKPTATVVWDRHEILFAYGPLEQFEKALAEAGFVHGGPAVPDPHSHHYHAEFDPDEAALLGALNWRYSPLRPEDQQ